MRETHNAQASVFGFLLPARDWRPPQGAVGSARWRTGLAVADRQVNQLRMTIGSEERKLWVAMPRIDSTLVASNIAPPGDSQLLADGVRVLSRLMAKSRRV